MIMEDRQLQESLLHFGLTDLAALGKCTGSLTLTRRFEGKTLIDVSHSNFFRLSESTERSQERRLSFDLHSAVKGKHSDSLDGLNKITNGNAGFPRASSRQFFMASSGIFQRSIKSLIHSMQHSSRSMRSF